MLYLRQERISYLTPFEIVQVIIGLGTYTFIVVAGVFGALTFIYMMIKDAHKDKKK